MTNENKGIAGAMPAIGIGMDIANAVGGWFGGNKRQEQQYQYQRKLNEQMAQLQRDNWDYTNAENQRKHYEKAGLNVGLMYGSSGGGGATMGGGSGGSVGMAETPKFMGMGIQGALAESTIELNKANAEKLSAEAKKIGGVDTDKANVEIQSLDQGIKNQKAQERLTEMETNLKGVEYDLKEATLNDSIGIVRNELNAGLKQIYILENQGVITSEEARISREKWGLELTGMNLNNILTKSKTSLTDEQTKATTQGIINDMRNVLTNIRNANTNERNMLINEWKQATEKELKTRGLDQEDTKIFMDAIEMIFNSFSKM